MGISSIFGVLGRRPLRASDAGHQVPGVLTCWCPASCVPFWRPASFRRPSHLVSGVLRIWSPVLSTPGLGICARILAPAGTWCPTSFANRRLGPKSQYWFVGPPPNIGAQHWVSPTQYSIQYWVPSFVGYFFPSLPLRLVYLMKNGRKKGPQKFN